MPTKKTKPQRIPESEIFAAAHNYETAAQEEAAAKVEKERTKKVLLTQLHEIRKVRAVESDKYGGFTRITVVQNEGIEYDADGMYRDLTPVQRRLAFDRNINFNALPAETRKKILEVVPKDELKAVTTRSLNVERLSQAVQDNKIDGKVVAKHSEIVKSAPYIRISHGTGE